MNFPIIEDLHEEVLRKMNDITVELMPLLQACMKKRVKKAIKARAVSLSEAFKQLSEKEEILTQIIELTKKL